MGLIVWYNKNKEETEPTPSGAKSKKDIVTSTTDTVSTDNISQNDEVVILKIDKHL